VAQTSLKPSILLPLPPKCKITLFALTPSYDFRRIMTGRVQDLYLEVIKEVNGEDSVF
jgi:hypothetical protein